MADLSSKRKVLIPIFHGHIARNILHTNVLGELSQRAKVILLVPDFKKDLYTKEFGSERVTVVSSPEITFSRLDKFFRSFYYYFLNKKKFKIIKVKKFKLKKIFLKYYKPQFLTKFFVH